MYFSDFSSVPDQQIQDGDQVLVRIAAVFAGGGVLLGLFLVIRWARSG